ncbi:DUF2625 domain-containing protein [Pseudoflavitalea rhizosphaerae]|uniref:DUF2625 domain-containing protein n=1 Tax=Pseudoflavitalea rhizosphaerae TaxID=1884793 RepID=UPI0019D16B37|nr:DUF2625 domain-containing protein [Pseudoflavitalea rhizosphaerae]
MKMRPLNELINKKSDTWKLLQSDINSASNPIEILPKNKIAADSALYYAQVTTNSPMGAIIYETGGILVDSGWLRILGSGSNQLPRSLMNWNMGKSITRQGERPPFLLVADDVIGGFFAINGGGLDSASLGKVFYFTPDNPSWMNLQLTYSAFLQFCFSGDLSKFYEGMQWKNWRNDISKIKGDQGFSFYPLLWSKESQENFDETQMQIVPIEELWNLYFKKIN